jgi:hypothetical protein
MSKIKDDDIRINCPDKATCYEHLHNLEAIKAYRKECKLSKKYFACLQEIREELEEDITCESRECGCDDYGECLNCLKDIILTKIKEVIGAE